MFVVGPSCGEGRRDYDGRERERERAGVTPVRRKERRSSDVPLKAFPRKPASSIVYLAPQATCSFAAVPLLSVFLRREKTYL